MGSKTDAILDELKNHPDGIDPSMFYDSIEAAGVPRASATAITSQLVRAGRIAKGEDGLLRPVAAVDRPPRKPRERKAANTVWAPLQAALQAGMSPDPQPAEAEAEEEPVSELRVSVDLRANVAVIEHGGGSVVLGWQDLDELLAQAERARAALAEV